MEEKEFKERFIVNFISSYAATVYDGCCQQGKYERLSDLPVEDAIFLAKDAWEKYLEHSK